MTIYILSDYNNYYNRIVKKEDTLSDYIDKYTVEHQLTGVNFVPGNGINTQHVFGTNANSYSGKGDYLIVADTSGNIVSRWFIIDCERNRAGQFTLTLHRDLVVDYYEDIVDAPMYVEKATLNNNDPMIWNNENLAVNQIKKYEFPIHDETNCAWLVGYISRNYEGGPIEIGYSYPVPDYTTESISTFVSGISKQYALDKHKIYFNISGYGKDPVVKENFLVQLDSSSPDKWERFSTTNTSTFNYKIGAYYPDKILNNTTNKQQLLEQAKLYFTSGHTYSKTGVDSLFEYNGKIVKDSVGRYYTLKVREVKQTYATAASTNKSTIDGISSIPTYIETKFKTLAKTVDPNHNVFPTPLVEWTETAYEVIYESYSITPFVLNFPSPDQRNHLNDAPYDMFCIPYPELLDSNGRPQLGGIIIDPLDSSTPILIANYPSKYQVLAMAQSLAEALSTNLLDMQILPYCPLTSYKYTNALSLLTTTVVSISENEKRSNDFYFKFDNNSTFVMFFPTQSHKSITVPYRYGGLAAMYTKVNEMYRSNKKITNECQMVRLVSPNYNGQFQFNVAKNNGVSDIDIDFTYLPYSPYIHVNPRFRGLYGSDYNDARGLICQGDFSISYMSNKWTDYQVQNKNYANTFNRQIQNLELQQDVQRKQQLFNAVTGTVMGGTAGAVAGSKAGVYGAIAGAVVGTAASAVGGALDVYYADLLRNETLDYTKDMFNYSLENIQALPESIQKVTAFTNNNKIFPLLEIYECTPTEMDAVANKIAYNGMTVMRIGTISEFVGNTWSWTYTDNSGNAYNVTSKGYIKGKLIRSDSIEEDFRILNAIADELNKGVYIE